MCGSRDPKNAAPRNESAEKKVDRWKKDVSGRRKKADWRSRKRRKAEEKKMGGVCLERKKKGAWFVECR
ncbi:unnamed protein product [Caenorhabditis nigoni]